MPTPYKNPRIEAELEEDEIQSQQEQIIKEVPKTPEDENWSKRYADLRRHSSQKEAQFQEQIARLEKQMQDVSSGKMKPPKTEEDLRAFMEEYPDFSEVMKVMIDREVSDKTKDLKSQSNEIKIEKAKNALRKIHPDMDEVLSPSNTDFHDWLMSESKIHQDYIYKKLDVDNAAFVIDKYKALKQRKAPQSEELPDNRSAARAVRPNKGGPSVDERSGQFLYSESQIAAMSDKDWEIHGDKVLAAQRQGKVELDISGGAR